MVRGTTSTCESLACLYPHACPVYLPCTMQELLSSVESRMLSTAQAVQSKLGLLHQTLTPLQVSQHSVAHDALVSTR